MTTMLRLLLLITPFVASALAAPAFLESARENSSAYFDSARHWILGHATGPQKLLLYQHLPGLFAPSFVCKSAPGEGKTLLPGDAFVAINDESELQCARGLSIQLKKGSRLILEDEKGLPAIALQDGFAVVRGGTLAPFVIRFGNEILSIAKPASDFELILAKKGEEHLASCSRGILKGTYEIDPAGPRNKGVVASSGCVFELELKGKSPPRLLYSGDFFHPADLAVQRKMRAALSASDLEKFGVKFNSDSPTAFPVYASITDKSVVLHWDAHGKELNTCTVFTQADDNSPRVQAYKFSSQAGRWSLELHPDYKKYIISMSCDTAAGPVVSNAVLPP